MNSLSSRIPGARQAGTCVRGKQISGISPWSSKPRSAHVCRVNVDDKATKKKSASQLPYQSRKTFDELAGGLCIAPSVSVDNSNPDFTEVTVEAVDYPGLLRVIAWVMNGLGLRVHSAKLYSSDAVAVDKFWLTTVKGQKLSDKAAEDVAERLQDFVTFCSPDEEMGDKLEFTSGHIQVYNGKHPLYTELVIRGEPQGRQGHLLEIASVITGLGIIIHEAVIKSCGACTDATGEAPLPAMPSEPQAGGQQPSSAAPADAQHDFRQGRLFRLWVSDSKGGKLDLQRISALLYTLELVMGRGHQPTVAPNIGMFVPGASAK